MKALIGVELLRKLPKGPVDVRDTKLPGFVLRVRESGTHTYFANYARGKWKALGTTKVLNSPEAREQARKALGEAMQGGDPIADQRAEKAAERQRLTFDAFLTAHYEPWATAHRQTGAEQTARLRTVFGPALNGLRLDEISAFHIERWRSARLKDGRAPETCNRDLNTLRGALSRAVEWHLVAAHPLKAVKNLRTDKRRHVRYLSEAERTRLLAALTARDDKRRAERTRANQWRQDRGYAAWPAHGVYTDHLAPLVLTALHTGLRRGELFSLTWGDVALTRAVVTVRGDEAKSQQTRHVPLNREVLRVLRDWQPEGATATDLVFPGRTKGESLEDIKTAWAALMKAAKIQEFRFHDCRHDFASQLVMRGIDLNSVRELLGHSDIKMVLRYAHLSPDHLAAAVGVLAR
jgi:integrase